MSEDSGGLSNSNEDEPPDEIGENLPASINGNKKEQHLVGGKIRGAMHRHFGYKPQAQGMHLGWGSFPERLT